MLNHHPVLSLLGLALRGGRLVVGEEPVEGIVRARDARVLLLARDASDNTFRRCRHFADVGQCLWVTLPFTKDEIGSAVGRSSVAIMAVTDVGLAHAIVQKLANEDPKRYGEAAERRAEQKAHEKNVRTGKYHGKQPAPKLEEPQPKKQSRREESPKQQEAPRKRTASRPSKENRPKPRAASTRFAHSRPVKKGKGSFRKKEG